jgi:hypothetical protein
MSKIILEFDSETEFESASAALNGWKWRHVVDELDNKLRATTKYGNSVITEGQEASEMEYQIAEKYREMLRDIVYENGLSLDY